MGGFRIGRTRAQHTYPVPRAATTVPYARNTAVGPTTNTDFTTVIPVPWSIIESIGGAPGTFNDVPITPKSTGIVRIAGVISVAADSPVVVQVAIKVGVSVLPVPGAEFVTVSLLEAIPVLITVPPAFTPVGVATNIEILVTAAGGTATLIAASSSLDVQEVVPVTG